MNPQTEFANLCLVSERDRNSQWEDLFLSKLPQTLLTVDAESPIVGPDGFSYLFVSQKSDSKEQAEKIFKWLLDAGVGLVVNGEKSPPDYVLNYGAIWYFAQTGRFFEILDRPTQELFDADFRKLRQGRPSETFLPTRARRHLREFFHAHDQGLDPKVVLLTEDGKNFDLGFSLESVGNPPESEQKGLAEAISWFLPAHYSIVLLPEQPPIEFYNL